MPTPSVGRVVHYVSHGTPIRPDGTQAYTQQCRAATITEVGAWINTDTEMCALDGTVREVRQEWNPDAVGIHVVNPTGQFFTQGVLHDPGSSGPVVLAMCDGRPRRGGTWHWPARTGE
jgi:hypothetical protein